MQTYKWDRSKTDFEVGVRGHNFEDLTGQRFTKLVVQYPIRIKKLVKWVCLCDCGRETNVSNGSLKNGGTTSCGCIRSETLKIKNQSVMYKGVGELSGYHFNRIRYGASNRELEFKITKEYLWELFLTQDKKCALSGLELKFGRVYKKEESTASVDRIDSSKGYIEGNVQWVHTEVNKMKFTKTDIDFVHYCTLVANYNKKE